MGFSLEDSTLSGIHFETIVTGVVDIYDFDINDDNFQQELKNTVVYDPRWQEGETEVGRDVYLSDLKHFRIRRFHL